MIIYLSSFKKRSELCLYVQWRVKTIPKNFQDYSTIYRRTRKLRAMGKGSGNTPKGRKRNKGKLKTVPSSPSTPSCKTPDSKCGKFQGKLSHSSPIKTQQRPITDYFSPASPTKLQTKDTDTEKQTEVPISCPIRTSPRKHPPSTNSISLASSHHVMGEMNGLSATPHKIQICEPINELSPSTALSDLSLLSPRRVTKSRRRLNVCPLSNQLHQPPAKSKANLNEKKNILSNVETKCNLLKQINEPNNHTLTEYFPVRRSVRKTKKTVMEEKQKSFEEAVLSQKEEGLEVHNFEGKGRGIVTRRKFTRGEFVVEYAGQLLDMIEAKRREELYAQDQNTGCYMYYFKHNNIQYCIDATTETGRFGRLVNHSRNGNLTTKIICIQGSDPHLVLIAKDDIEPGVEVTYDYGDRSKESLKYHPWLAS